MPGGKQAADRVFSRLETMYFESFTKCRRVGHARGRPTDMRFIAGYSRQIQDVRQIRPEQPIVHVGCDLPGEILRRREGTPDRAILAGFRFERREFCC